MIGGTPALRTMEGERQLEEGEVVSFPRGERGAHQVVNRTEQPVPTVVDVPAHPMIGE